MNNQRDAVWIDKRKVMIKKSLTNGETRYELLNLLNKSKNHHDVWIENRASTSLSKRHLAIEMEKHFNLHLG